MSCVCVYLSLALSSSFLFFCTCVSYFTFVFRPSSVFLLLTAAGKIKKNNRKNCFVSVFVFVLDLYLFVIFLLECFGWVQCFFFIRPLGKLVNKQEKSRLCPIITVPHLIVDRRQAGKYTILPTQTLIQAQETDNLKSTWFCWNRPSNMYYKEDDHDHQWHLYITTMKHSLIIRAAVDSGHQLWTVDSISKIANVVKLGFEPSPVKICVHSFFSNFQIFLITKVLKKFKRSNNI